MSSGHYEQLQVVREDWCNRSDRPPNRSGIIVELAGSQIDDIPGFYLALGEAVNGTGGYFGACLDSLDDCLCGHFGLCPPFTVRIRNSEKARRAIERNQEEWTRLCLERCSIVEDDEDTNYQTSDGSDSPNSNKSYWEQIMRIFRHRNVTIVLDSAFA